MGMHVPFLRKRILPNQRVGLSIPLQERPSSTDIKMYSGGKFEGDTTELEFDTTALAKVVALTLLRLIYHQRSGAFKIVLQCCNFVKGNIHGIHGCSHVCNPSISFLLSNSK